MNQTTSKAKSYCQENLNSRQENLNSRQENLNSRPKILVTMGAREYEGIHYQVMGKKYLEPLMQLSNCMPILVPTCQDVKDLQSYLDIADGLYMTGATSNVNPALYGEDLQTPECRTDFERDDFNQQLIKAGLTKGLPLFGVCRGMQEVNVAYGGTIYQKVHEVKGMMDHREPQGDVTLEEEYGASHTIKILPNTWLAKKLPATEYTINSLHGQGIKKLGQGLKPLAVAPDGLIEAYSCSDLAQFTIAVQWHPEWLAHENPLSIQLFNMFGDACREFQKMNH